MLSECWIPNPIGIVVPSLFPPCLTASDSVFMIGREQRLNNEVWHGTTLCSDPEPVAGPQRVGGDLPPSVRIDPNTGKPGLRVRQGLGTSDEVDANDLKDQLNQLLADESFWACRPGWRLAFITPGCGDFYHGMEPEENDAKLDPRIDPFRCRHRRSPTIGEPCSWGRPGPANDAAPAVDRHGSGDRALSVDIDCEDHGA